MSLPLRGIFGRKVYLATIRKFHVFFFISFVQWFAFYPFKMRAGEILQIKNTKNMILPKIRQTCCKKFWRLLKPQDALPWVYLEPALVTTPSYLEKGIHQGNVVSRKSSTASQLFSYLTGWTKIIQTCPF